VRLQSVGQVHRFLLAMDVNIAPFAPVVS
jgi:hypothetical protein